MRYSILLMLLFSFYSNHIKAQYQWDGDNPVGNLSYSNNWYGNSLPTLNNSGTALQFEYRNNGSQTSLYYDLGYWADVQSIIFQSTFGASAPLNGNGNGINFWFKIENKSSFPQLVNVPLSAKGTGMELNPTNADLTINNILYNDFNRNILVYGPNTKKLFLKNAIIGNASTQLQIKQYSIVSIGFANTSSTSSFGGGAHIEVGELWFEENSSLNGGVITIGNGNSNAAKLYLQDLNGGYTLPNNITVQASSPNCFVGGLNTSGTNTYSGNITLNAPLQLENSSGGTSQFTGNISGSHGVTIDDVGGTGNAIIQYSGVSKTYTGTTTINSGATLRISSNQSLGNIVVNAGGTLIVDAGVELTVTGNFTNSGTVTGTTGAFSLGGNFENNGTFTAGTGSHTFTGANKTISGSANTSIPSLAVTGSYTNSMNLTVGTALSGVGTLTNTGTLNIGGTSEITTLTASASGNTVNYTGAAQTIKTTAYHNLGLDGSGIKTAPSSTLTISGNLIKSGTSTFNPNNGLVLLNGSGSQTLAGLPYSRLQLTNGSKTTSGSASIDSLLKIDASTTLNVSSGDSIVILSTANRTASVGRMEGTINYLGAGLTAGKFVVQRYLLSGRKWRLLSVPTNNINQTVRNSWQENGIDNAGFGFRALDTRSNWASLGYDGLGNNSSIKKFNPITVSWDAIDNTNVMTLQTESAYFVFVPGDRSITFPGSGSTTLRTRGQLITGNVGSINVPDGQFAVIGNPYASRIDIRNINFTGLGIDQSITIWDPSLTTGYGLGAFNQLIFDGTSYNNLLPSAVYGPFNTPNNFIESGQAFVVRATGNSSITFNEDDKVLGSNLASFVAGDPQQLRVHLNVVPNGGTPVLLDGVMTQFDTSYSKAVDYLDIKKINPFGESVSWDVAESLIVIERRAPVVATDTLQLMMGNLREQNYQWELIAENLDYPGREGFLIDRFQNSSTPLNMAGTTTFNFDVQNVAGSFAANRFYIVFNQQAGGPLPVTFTTVTATRNADRSVAVQWKVEQEINIVAYEVERSNNGSNFTPVHNRTAAGNNSSSITYDHIDLTPYRGDNFYRIKATSVGGQVQYSNIVKLNGGKATPIISVYPNPVVNKQLQLRFEEQEKGRYQVQLMNMKGQVLVNKTVNMLNTVQAETIELSASLAAGNYQLVVTAPNGNRTKQTVLVQ